MGDDGSDRIQRILSGVGLITVGAFTLLSLVPLGLFGEGFRGLFPSGNVVGPVGATVSDTLVGAFGVSAAVTPLFLVVWGTCSLRVLEREETIRWTLFFATILALVPIMISTGAGSEIMKPIATPTVGGMVTATILNLILVPVIFTWVLQSRLKREKLEENEEE